MAVSHEDRQRVADLARTALERVGDFVDQFHREFPEFRLTDSSGYNLAVGLVDPDYANSSWIAFFETGSGHTIPRIEASRARAAAVISDGNIEKILTLMKDRVP